MTARLLRDARGTTIIEFGFLAPVLMLMLVGILDLGYTAYVTAAVQGAVQKAARDASLQTNASTAAAAALDAKVTQQIQALGRNLSTPTFTRRSYRDYNAAAAKAFETFTDGNGDHRCNANEWYTDRNGNMVWDSDGGTSGTGGAQDRTVYTVSVSFTRALPLDQFIPSLGRTIAVSATTTLANQPYADQGSDPVTPVQRQCTP